jgi:predicted DsbA family dithiol-disulfide isomerase
VSLPSNSLVKVAVLLLAALSGYAVLFWPEDQLEFVELSSAPGFRELVVETGRPGNSQPWTVGLPDLRRNAPKGESADLCDLLFEGLPRNSHAGGPLRVVYFSDYRCPYCRTLSERLSDIESTGKIQTIYKEWPVLGESSVLAARAALAAGKQGHYEAFHRRLMGSRLVPTQSYIEVLANELNLDVPRLVKDIWADSVSAALQRSDRLAFELGLTGTPALVVGRTIVRGEINPSRLERLISLEAESKRAC